VDDLVRTGLHESMTDIIDRTQEIGSAVHRTFFDASLEFAPTQSQSQVQAGA
jgi:hypothetical protein